MIGSPVEPRPPPSPRAVPPGTRWDGIFLIPFGLLFMGTGVLLFVLLLITPSATSDPWMALLPAGMGLMALLWGLVERHRVHQLYRHGAVALGHVVRHDRLHRAPASQRGVTVSFSVHGVSYTAMFRTETSSVPSNGTPYWIIHHPVDPSRNLVVGERSAGMG